MLANDSDPNGDTLTVVEVSAPAHGTAVVAAAGTVEYTPGPDFHGTDRFTYVVGDGSGLTARAAVEVTVLPVNDPPLAGDDAADTPEDTSVTIAVLRNDSDGDGDALALVEASVPAHGSARLTDAGAAEYTPEPDFHGTVSPLHVAAYIRTHPGSVPTVKQHLAAIRMLGDWLVVNQVLRVNPAAAVRGPKHVVTKGSTPVLSPAEARKLLETIDTGTLAGLPPGRCRPLDAYVEAGGIDEPKAALFQSMGPGGAVPVGPGARAAGGPGDDQAARCGRGATALDVLPHVPGDGDHGVLVERRNPRARAADRRGTRRRRRRSSTIERRTR